jgi:hypothetical protein
MRGISDENTVGISRMVLAHLAKKLLPSATMIEASGIWEGQPEPTILLEVISPAYHVHELRVLAEEYARMRCQEAVLYTRHEIESTIMFGRKN